MSISVYPGSSADSEWVIQYEIKNTRSSGYQTVPFHVTPSPFAEADWRAREAFGNVSVKGFAVQAGF